MFFVLTYIHDMYMDEITWKYLAFTDYITNKLVREIRVFQTGILQYCISKSTFSSLYIFLLKKYLQIIYVYYQARTQEARCIPNQTKRFTFCHKIGQKLSFYMEGRSKTLRFRFGSSFSFHTPQKKILPFRVSYS